jgi:hypothetical protein
MFGIEFNEKKTTVLVDHMHKKKKENKTLTRVQSRERKFLIFLFLFSGELNFRRLATVGHPPPLFLPNSIQCSLRRLVVVGARVQLSKL